MASEASDVGGFRVAVVEQGEHRRPRGEKGVLRRVGLSFQQPARALEPAFGDTLFAAERGAVPGDPDCDAGGRRVIAAAAIGTKGALARIEDDLGEVEPPRRQAQTFERFGRLLDRQQPFEGFLRLRPGSGFESCATGGQMVNRRRGAHSRIISSSHEERPRP